MTVLHSQIKSSHLRISVGWLGDEESREERFELSDEVNQVWSRLSSASRSLLHIWHAQDFHGSCPISLCFVWIKYWKKLKELHNFYLEPLSPQCRGRPHQCRTSPSKLQPCEQSSILVFYQIPQISWIFYQIPQISSKFYQIPQISSIFDEFTEIIAIGITSSLEISSHLFSHRFSRLPAYRSELRIDWSDWGLLIRLRIGLSDLEVVDQDWEWLIRLRIGWSD